jgi:hypothetical protein
MIADQWKAPPDADPVKEDAPEPFPMECLPGAAEVMAREIARVTTSQSEPLAAAAVLGILSASIGAGIEVNTGGERRTRGNLFTLAIADSGTGKGEAYKLAADPFEALEAEEIESFEMHVKPGLLAELNVATARANKLCKDAAKESDRHARQGTLAEYRNAEEERADLQRQIESAPRWKVADVTQEALAVVMQGQPGEAVASLSSEARGIFSIVKGKYSKEGGDEGFYCSGYSGDSLTADRVGRPRVTLRRPCLSILWMIQPDAARKAFDDDSMTESGLLPRFLIFDPKAEPQERNTQPAPIPPAIKTAWAALIADLVDSYRRKGNDPRTATTSREALAVLADYENENIRRRRPSGDLRDLAPYVARWTENAWRIAVVLHAARHGSKGHAAELDGGTARDAVKVMRWFSDRQLETLSAGRWEKLRKRLLALLAVLAEANGEISLRDLRRSHSFEEEEIRQLQATFPKSFRIVRRKPEKGRPSEVVTNRLEDIKDV